MLREHHAVDKLFEEIAAHIPGMNPVLTKVDGYLEDEKLYRLIKKDLSKRWPRSDSSSVENAGDGTRFDAGGGGVEDVGGEATV